MSTIQYAVSIEFLMALSSVYHQQPHIPKQKGEISLSYVNILSLGIHRSVLEWDSPHQESVYSRNSKRRLYLLK